MKLTATFLVVANIHNFITNVTEVGLVFRFTVSFEQGMNLKTLISAAVCDSSGNA